MERDTECHVCWRVKLQDRAEFRIVDTDGATLDNVLGSISSRYPEGRIVFVKPVRRAATA
jgi:hypothetical protein